MLRKRKTVMGIALLAALLLAGCGGEETEAVTDRTVAVTTQTIGKGTLKIENSYIGTVMDVGAVKVVPLVSAEVLSVEVSVGDKVEEGQVLAQLNSEAAELQLASAQAQYNSAAAGVHAAEVGYEIAQAQYEGTVAQLDAQMGGQKNLQLYQLQMNVDSVQDGIDDIYEAIGDLEEDRADLKEDKDDYKDQRDKYRGAAAQAQAAVSVAEKLVTAYDNAEYFNSEQQYTVWKYDENGNKTNEVLKNYTGEAGIAAYQADMAKAKEKLSSARNALQQAQSAAEQYDSAYEQAKDGLDAYDDSRADLEEKLADTYGSLTDAEAIFNITAEQVYGDTQKVVDANKKTAALSIDSAEASVDSAKRGAESAQVGIDSAEYQMELYTIKAPVSGVVEQVNLSAHNMGSSGQVGFVITNPAAKSVAFYVQNDVRKEMEVGQKVEIFCEDKTYQGVIDEIGVAVDAQTGMFLVKAGIRNGDDLANGTQVELVTLAHEEDDAPIIPLDAIYFNDGEPYIYLYEEGVAVLTPIEIALHSVDQIAAADKTLVGKELIISWSSSLKDGAKVHKSGESSSGENDESVTEVESVTEETNVTEDENVEGVE